MKLFHSRFTSYISSTATLLISSINKVYVRMYVCKRHHQLNLHTLQMRLPLPYQTVQPQNTLSNPA